MAQYSPITLFVYNRLNHTKKTVEALLRNDEAKYSDLFIFSDGAKKDTDSPSVKEVRDYIRTIKGFKKVEIIEREVNWGLARNLIDGISNVIKKYGRIIVVEDDIITSPYFLKFMNEGLEKYADNDRIASIQGYTYPLDIDVDDYFFIKWQGCWGWATWDRAWKLFNPDADYLYEEIKKRNLQREFNADDTYKYMLMLRNQRDGKINSWAIRWYASVFLNNKLIINPGKSLVFNSGFDGNGGTHCTEKSNKYDTEILSTPIKWDKDIRVEESIVARKAYIRFFKKTSLGKKGMISRFIHHLNLDFIMIGFLNKYKWRD